VECVGYLPKDLVRRVEQAVATSGPFEGAPSPEPTSVPLTTTKANSLPSMPLRHQDINL
jgi:hypothetical protein